MIKTTLLILTFIFPATAFGQDFLWKAVYDPPETKTDWVKESIKLSSYGAAYADARTTIESIRRGSFESNSFNNILIDSRSPSPGARYALLVGQNYVANLCFDYFYKKSDKWYYRWTLIGLRAFMVGYQVHVAIRNTTWWN